MKIFFIGLGRINTENNDGGAIRALKVFKYFTKKKISLFGFISEGDFKRFKESSIKGNYLVIKDNKYLSINDYLIYIYRTIKAILQLHKIHEKYDFVYALSDFFYDFVPAFLYKLLHKRTFLIVNIFLLYPSIFNSYETLRINKYKLPNFKSSISYLTQLIIIFLAGWKADKIFVLNEADRNKLIFYHILPHKIEVVSMGIDKINIKRPIQYKYDAIYLGRFHKQKGLDDLISIWKLVVKITPKVKMLVIGGGGKDDIKQFLTRVIHEKLQDNIIYLGYRDGKEKYSLTRHSKIMLVPSHHESWGQVIAEGLNCGLNVITYDLPIYKNIFSSYVFKIKCFNRYEFSAMVVQLLKRKCYFNNSGRKYIQKYLWDKVAKFDESVFKKVLYEKS